MKVYKFEKVRSTQKIARRLMHRNENNEFIVIAKEQTGGYGRHGRNWHSPSGGLYASIALKIHTKNLNIIPLASALAVRKAISKTCKINVKVKWPNDIVVNNKKLGGIISEAIFVGEKLKHLIIGIGINVNTKHEQFPSKLKEKATSILIETGKKIKIESILNEIIKNLTIYKELIEKKLEKIILNEWREHDIILGQEIQVSNEEEIIGYAMDIKRDGALILRRRDGRIIELYAEDIKIENVM